MYVKSTDLSLGKQWKLCNDGGHPCYGNGNYDFREIMIPKDGYEAAAERINRLIDPKLHAQDVKEKLELFKSYRFNQYAISAVILLNYLYR